MMIMVNDNRNNNDNNNDDTYTNSNVDSKSASSSTSTGTGTTTTESQHPHVRPLPRRPPQQHRRPPYGAILDPTFVRDQLDLSEKHLSGFYQALHRQDYPNTIREFLAGYHNDYSCDGCVVDNVDGTAATCPSTMKITVTAADDADQRGPLEKMDVEETTTNFHCQDKKKKKNHKIQLPKRFLASLKDLSGEDGNDKKNSILTSKVYSVHHSADTLTTKLVIELHDGMMIESVIMRYDQKTTIPRASLCVSSQVGCAMGCTFCATGTMGKIGDLNVAEILEQIIHANRVLRSEAGRPSVRNVVFMGMGEPLDNYNNVVSACKALIDKRRWNLAHGRITVSTVGIVSKIRQLSRDLPEVSLALSLHAPNQKLRETIVPTAHRYPITELIDALDSHMSSYDITVSMTTTQQRDRTNKKSTSTNHLRKAMIEYVLLQGPTSTVEAAHELGRLCRNRKFVVNLIPYNSTDSALQCPPREQMRSFRNIVASYGVFCTIRRTMGADIDSACGQLVKKQHQHQQNAHEQRRRQSGTTGGAPDIEDVVPNRNRPERTKNITTDSNDTSPRGSLSKSTATTLTKNRRPTDLGDYVEVIGIATALAACSFVASLTLLLRKKR